MSAVTPKRVAVRELRQTIDRLTAERDRAAKRASKHRRTIRDMEETRRLNLEELWHEAARQPYDDHDIDDVLVEVGDLRMVVDCIKRVLPRMSEEARDDYFRVFDELLAEENARNGTP